VNFLCRERKKYPTNDIISHTDRHIIILPEKESRQVGGATRTMVVYIDVLFVLNLIVNYFILLAVSRLLNRRDKRPRLFAGASLGALYASLMFFPQLGFLYTAVIKLVLSVTIVAASFKIHSVRNLLKLLAFFYIISMLFGGIIFAVEYFLAPPKLIVQNGIAYMDISPLFLILSGAGCYILLTLFSRMLHRDVHTGDIYTITVEVESASVSLTALLDNGNDLCDAISGSPVIIAEYSRVEPLIPSELRTVFRTGRFAGAALPGAAGFGRRFRVVPYSSVGNAKGLLPAFRPDRLTVDKAGIVSDNVLIAVANRRLSDDGVFSALLNPRLFGAARDGEAASNVKRESYTDPDSE
jgi:stage II sporulation protein GA (sporulation sigma-E factor processing peptidase)